MVIGTLVILVLLLISLLWCIHHANTLKQQALSHMRDRPSLTPREFGSHFYDAEKAAIATAVRETLDDVARIDMSQIAPSDLLEEDLKLGSLDSLAVLDLALHIERRLNVKIRLLNDEPPWRTIDDVIQCVMRQQSVRTNQGVNPVSD